MGNKIMARNNLEDIVTRLNCCHSVLSILWTTMAEEGVNGAFADALCGCADLLNSICEDFEASIRVAKDVPDERTAA